MSEMIERVAQAICGGSLPTDILEIHRGRARLAIKAMRNPTFGMISKPQIDCWQQSYVNEGQCEEIWKEMIDEALK